jgi:uncharacterized protein
MRASLAGLLTGIAAGFVGVGGGEFRIPVLIRVLRLSVHTAAGVNLLVGLFTVALSAYRRLGQRTISDEAVTLAWAMGIASIAGAVIGVASRKRIAVRPLIRIVRVYLIVAGAWMLYESIWHAHHVLADPQGMTRWMLAATAAFAIAAVRGVMGVAGGEMRIPVLLYLFSVPIIEAGTLSLLVSIPNVACGAITDRRLGGIRGSALRVALVMGIGSAVGVLAGAALVPYANRETIKGVLGVVLLMAAIRLDTVKEKVG